MDPLFIGTQTLILLSCLYYLWITCTSNSVGVRACIRSVQVLGYTYDVLLYTYVVRFVSLDVHVVLVLAGVHVPRLCASFGARGLGCAGALAFALGLVHRRLFARCCTPNTGVSPCRRS